MNVLKPALQSTVKTLLSNEISQREINRKTGIDRKTIRRYARSYDLTAAQETEFSKSPTPEGMATGSGELAGQNPPPRPPALGSWQTKIPHPGHRLRKAKSPNMRGRHANPTRRGLRLR